MSSTKSLALPRATPESVGISSQAILDFLQAAQAQGPGQEPHSLIVLRHGKVVAEGYWSPYRKDRRHLLYSLSKSFTSSAVGLAISEGLLSLDDPVISFFPDETPAEPSENLKAMKVRHLLSMSAGQETEPWANLDRTNANNWIEGFLKHPVSFEPGSQFLYNSIATFMLSAIVEKLTGESLLNYLKPRLLDPLGIHEATWDVNPQGIVVGGWGMSIVTESIAKFGLLCLQDGIWEGKRILPEGWVAQATSKQVSNGDDPNNDWNVGYGFQFWRCKVEGCYRGDGAFGQLCVVIPQKQMVIAMTACVDFINELLDLTWNHLLPAAEDSPLPENPTLQNKLSEELASLKIPALPGQTFSSQEAFLTGLPFSFEGDEFDELRWNFSAEACTLTISKGDETHLITAGRKQWREGETTYENERKQPIAAQAAWVSESTFKVTIQYLEEPASISFAAEFHGKGINVTVSRRGRFTSEPVTTFKGQLKA